MENDLITFSKTSGRIEIECKAVKMGEDLCVMIQGGDTPHIGAIAIKTRDRSAEEKSGKNKVKIISLPGHKEALVIDKIADNLSSALNKNIVVCCGIHVQDATKDEIVIIQDMLTEMTSKLIQSLNS